MGHYSGDCTKATVQRGRPPKTAVTLLITAKESEEYEDNDDNVKENGFSFNMVGGERVNIEKKHILNPMWILLYSASTVNIFANKSLLRNIRHCG